LLAGKSAVQLLDGEKEAKKPLQNAKVEISGEKILFCSPASFPTSKFYLESRVQNKSSSLPPPE